MGRFINADVFASTGQGILGNNMFAYCNNNPVMYSDPTGKFFIDWDLMPNKEAGEHFGKRLIELTEKDKETIDNGELIYTSNGKNGENEITNSHKIKTPWVMYAYVEENRGDEVAGSTMGVVWEWIVHNAGYQVGKVTNDASWINAGKDVNFGSTIYSDKHGGFGLLMKISYQILFPFQSQYDLNIYNLLQERWP